MAQWRVCTSMVRHKVSRSMRQITSRFILQVSSLLTRTALRSITLLGQTNRFKD